MRRYKEYNALEKPDRHPADYLYLYEIGMSGPIIVEFEKYSSIGIAKRLMVNCVIGE
jgi:hypothetical protein